MLEKLIHNVRFSNGKVVGKGERNFSGMKDAMTLLEPLD